MPDASPAVRGVYTPRRPQASPLFRLVSDHPHRLQTVYEDRFARGYGPWRPVVTRVADKFLACGVLDHGFACIRCDACTHEYLLAFSCTCRYFCPSGHAKRLAIWTQWLDTTLLAPVPHRQVVLTAPKRLRAYCLYRRRLLGEIARVAARTVTATIRTLTGEGDLAVGIVACLQTHGSRANGHPHLHLLVTDGGFRPDGTFVSWPAHDTARLTDAFRRAVLRVFVRLARLDEDQAAGMLTWPHSGFHVHTAVWVPENDRAFATRLARYCARPPVALERLTYDRTATAVTYRADQSDGPTAGTETVAPLAFLARVLVHIPDKGHVPTRYHGGDANRPRGTRGKAAPAAPDGPPAMGAAPRLAPTEATRRWAALLPQIFEGDPLACPTGHGAMRIVAFLTPASVIAQLLTHLRTRAARESHAGPRSPPIDAGPVPCRLRVSRAHPRTNRPRGTAARWRARRDPLTGAREAGNRGRYSPHPDRNSYRDAALDRLEGALRVDPFSPLPAAWKAMSLHYAGRTDAGLEVFDRWRSAVLEDSVAGMVWGLLLPPERAEELLALAEHWCSRLPGEPMFEQLLVRAHAFRGDAGIPGGGRPGHRAARAGGCTRFPKPRLSRAPRPVAGAGATGIPISRDHGDPPRAPSALLSTVTRVGPLRGQLSGRYRLERELGAGGMATVYLAHDLKHDRPVALKVLRPELGAVLGGERFLAEIRTTARLQHPHILPLLDSGEAAGLLYYVMPYVEGETLRARLERERQLGVDEVLRIVRALAGALDYAHAASIVHRDLKPENVLLQANEPVLADFGIALAVKSAGGERLTETGLSLGTPQYMSPEQAVGDRAVDARSDVYALGSVVYELLAGEPPHTGPTTAAVLMKVMTQPPVPLGVVRPGVPAQVEAAVMRALAKAPGDRFATAGAFVVALAAPTEQPSETAEKSIVVLPFDNLSPDPNDAYLADGLTEELISELSRLRVLKVISRNSAVAAKQRTRDTREIARLVGVRYVLDGSVRRAGNALRITAQLIDGTTNAHVWSEKYQGTMDDVFALQERLSLAIVDALRIQLSPQPAPATVTRPPRDLRAYEVFLRARHEMWQFSPDAFRRARDLVRHGLAVFPDNAELLATGAYVEWLAYGGGMDATPETLQRFGEFADRAVALDPSSPLGWFARARFAVNVGQSRKAIEFCRRSAALEPTGEALALLAVMEGYVGDDEAAATHAESAVALDPLGPFVLLWSAGALYNIGRPDAALGIAQRFDPEDWLGHFVLGLIHAHLGNRADAIRFFRRLESRHGGPADLSRIWLSALEGRPWRALDPSTRGAWLTEIGMALYAAEGYAAGGQRDEALFWARIAVLNGVQNDHFLTQLSPHFASLRDDPEFKTLIVLARGQKAVWRDTAREGTSPRA